ncbi:MAG: hypothetical protein ACTMIR_09470 [Cellulomonadaceae bacterium]
MRRRVTVAVLGVTLCAVTGCGTDAPQSVGVVRVLEDQQYYYACPWPGDDTRTLTIFADGMAHWVSDTGIEAWLSEAPREYDWVC